MILIVLCGLLLAYCIFMFNGLISLRNRSAAAWSDIDVQLKRRSTLVPNLVELVKGYASHERKTLEEVVLARNRALSIEGVKDRGEADRSLSDGVRQILAIAEAYPDLKASENFLQLQRQLIDTEEMIQNARRYYNAVVRDLNTKIGSFPDLVLAQLFGFRPREFFQLDDEQERINPRVSV